MGLRTVVLALVLVMGGCRRDGPETAPNIMPDDLPQVPAVQAAVGPWFVDRAPDYGLDVVTTCGDPRKRCVLDSLGVGLALFDVDGDGDLDLFVAAGSKVDGSAVVAAGGPWLFRNEGAHRWADITARSGLQWTGWAQGAAVADYDSDCDLDLFVCQHGRDTLWQNQGDATFRDVTSEAGITEDEWGVSATWGDVDGDGRPDLYVTNYLAVDPIRPPAPVDYLPGLPVFAGPSVLPGQPDRLWRNRGNGRFEDGTSAAGLSNPKGKGMSALLVDLDDDRLPDLYVTNDTQPNELFWNLGAGRFREGALSAGVAVDPFGHPEGSMAVDVADLDGDGRLDLAYSNFRREGTRVYRNLGGRAFQEISNESHVNPLTQQFVGWGLVLADFDDDGRPDLFQANGHVYPAVPEGRYDQPPLFLHNDGASGFVPVTREWGPQLNGMRSGRAVASGDLDGDGDLDLIMTTIDGPLRVLVNEGKRTNRAVDVRLSGRPPNIEALGAKVVIEAAGLRHVAVVRRGGSILAASDCALHFGLGPSAARVDRLTVQWPDGSTSTFSDLPVEVRIIVRQAAGTVQTIPFVPVRSPATARPRP